MAHAAIHDSLTRLVSGYWVSQMVYVAARLGVADALAHGAATVDELAVAVDADPRALYRLLRALASVGLFSEDETGRFSLTPLAEPLRTDAPGSLRPAVLMMVGQFYDAWGGLLESIRTGKSASELKRQPPFFEFLATHPGDAQIFDDAMTAFNARKTSAVLEAYDLSDVPILADIGGGNGANLFDTLRRYPAMRGVLFDLPAVVRQAAVRAGDVADRCQVIGGSFLEAVPHGASAYHLRHILHNWDDDRAITILKNVRGVMGEAAKLLVVERVIPPGNEPMFGKLMDLTMLVVHGGKERTEEGFRALFEAAGFCLGRVVPTGSDVCVIEGFASRCV